MFPKFIVRRADTGELVTGAFVLLPETDSAARAAINEYALMISRDLADVKAARGL